MVGTFETDGVSNVSKTRNRLHTSDSDHEVLPAAGRRFGGHLRKEKTHISPPRSRSTSKRKYNNLKPGQKSPRPYKRVVSPLPLCDAGSGDPDDMDQDGHLTGFHTASTRGHENRKPRTRPTEPTSQVRFVKVIPMAGLMQYPGFVVSLETTWDLFFLLLGSWLPEMKGIMLIYQNSVVIHYLMEGGWKPLAGDAQLRTILHEYSLAGTDLHVRCAPEEFRSSVDRSGDEGIAMRRDDKRGSGDSANGRLARNEIVRHTVNP